MLTGLLTTLAAEIIPGAPTDGRVSRSPRSHGARVIAVPGSSGRILRGRLSIAPVRPPGRCRDCGGAVTGDRVRCDRCAARWLVDEAKRLASAGPARLAQLRGTGHDPAHGGNVEIARRATQLEHRAADAAWERRYGATGDPARWARLCPQLADVPVATLRTATGYSLRHCSRIRAGLVVPHPRVWTALERLAARPSG